MKLLSPSSHLPSPVSCGLPEHEVPKILAAKGSVNSTGMNAGDSDGMGVAKSNNGAGVGDSEGAARVGNSEGAAVDE